MDKKVQDSRYEQFYSDVLLLVNNLHEKNKLRARVCIGIIIALPFILGLIRWMTGSDKVVFLLIWVIFTMLTAITLISIEYYDHVMQKKLNELSERDEHFDKLLIDQERLSELKKKELSRLKRRKEVSDEDQ